MGNDKLKNEICALNPWFCPVQVGSVQVTPGIGSTWNAKKLTNRIVYRHKLLVDEVVKRYDFKGKRVLDLACNCAYWSARYVAHGAEYVFGVEGRPTVHKQAELYWKHNRFLPKDKYTFICGNVLDAGIWDKLNALPMFDVTLCAGILYHISDYRSLITRMANVTKDAMIIDTRVGDVTEKTVVEPGDLCFNAIKQTRAKSVPHLPNLLTCLDKLSFTCEILPVTFRSPPGLREQDDYNKKNRVTILARKIK